MKEFLKTKTFIVLLCVALVLTIVPSVLYSMGLSSVLKSAANVVIMPFQKAFNYAADALDGFVSYFTEFDRLAEENESLRAELEELREKSYDAAEIENEYKWLTEYLELKREHTDFIMTSANVTGRESGNYMTVFTLDRGSAHGINVGMPVITADGVVGYVAEVGVNWSKVKTLLESTVSIGVYVERSGEIGLVTSDYIMSRENICEMKYLPDDADVKIGDRVLTSGYGTVYPRGLVLGYVSDIKHDDYSQSTVAYITPTAELSDLMKVMIITDYEIYME